MISEFDYLTYRRKLKDCTMMEVLQMNEAIGSELLRRWKEEDESKYILPQPHNGVHSEITKLKLFSEVFNALSTTDGKDVDEIQLVMELLNTGKFNTDEVRYYMKKAMGNGVIYERRAGFYAKP